jgi:segregation and condensation protein B
MSEIDLQHLRLVEAFIFASTEPVAERTLQNRLPEDADLKAILCALQETYAGRGVNLIKSGKSWAFRTALDISELLNREVEVGRAPSRAAIETLAIIAYHQPVTRAEIEEIRGVSLSKGTLDVLFEAGWIKPRGRRQTPGRPVMWGTSDNFLDHFGLGDIRDLPGMDDLKAAGLLDASPAINAYRTTGSIAAASDGDENDTDDAGAEAEEGELRSMADEDAAQLADDPLAEDTGEVAEPLDPEAL